MLTTKRRIEKETDRFGGYGTEIVRSPLVSEYDRIYTDVPQAMPNITGEELNITNTAAPVAPEMPSMPEMPTFPETPTATAEPARQAERSAKPREREDILPTVKTRAYAKPNENAESATAPARRARGLDGKSKLMLCIYVIVAIALAIAVIVTGVTISGTAAKADIAARNIARNRATIAEQETTLAVLYNEDNIRGRAVVNGMVEAGEPEVIVDSIPDTGYPEAVPHTNGFDKFCDWLSNIMG